ncbi:hypothetical protein [Amaricoccus sp. W119]|uniref:hypothetical protein n=1 Tax=Amaricoccus sp. W119 TaxID=3391833 RepID=UPI0039A576F9
MGKRIRNFVDRAFLRTVDLGLLHRLLAPHLGQIGFDWAALPEDEKKRREAIFDLFARGGCQLRAEAPVRALQHLYPVDGCRRPHHPGPARRASTYWPAPRRTMNGSRRATSRSSPGSIIN